MDQCRNGRPLAVDRTAKSVSANQPAFLAPPPGAPVYHGFVVLDDVAIDGFTLGKITDFEAEPCEVGDGFVIAPDGSRAGLVWEVCNRNYFNEVRPPEPERWGVWGVGFTLPMKNREYARKNLESIVSELRPRWLAWKSQFIAGDPSPRS